MRPLIKRATSVLPVRQARTWLAEVLWVSAACALVVGMVEAYLLDRKINIFSGGYLADVRIEHLGARLVFAVVAFLSDLALLAPLVAAVLWGARHVRLHAAARALLASACALGFVGILDFGIYELHRYFGDLVSAAVVVRLVEGDLRELVYFGAPPIVRWAGPLLVAALLLTLAGGLLHRWFPTRMRNDPGGKRRTTWGLLVLVGVATVTSTTARLASPAFSRGLDYKPSGQVWGSLVSMLTDVDRDGYGLLSVPADPAPLDAARHPYALEVPGNGIDENGIGGDLPAGAAYEEPSPGPPALKARPDVVLVILETFRADATSTRIDGRPVTPTLHALAETGTQATRAYSHNGFTVQSRFHIFTGSLAGPRGRTSIIDDFNANGYQTAFFSAQDESFGAEMDVGFDRAEVRYDARVDRDKRFTQFSTPSSLTVSWKVLETRVSSWLRQRDRGRPLFLHLNYQDGHFPYTNPDVLPLVSPVTVRREDLRQSRADDIRLMYMNTLANVDASLGRVLELVEQTTGRRPVVVVVADHGESLFDHGGFLGHGYAANDAQTRIPLLVSGLPWEPEEPVGQVEVRDLLRQGLGGTKAPARGGEPGRVFQYVGTLAAPREIAWNDAAGRLSVDLHGSRWRRNEGPWQPLSSVASAGDDGRVATRLIHFWERLVIATRTHPDG